MWGKGCDLGGRTRQKEWLYRGTAQKNQKGEGAERNSEIKFKVTGVTYLRGREGGRGESRPPKTIFLRERYVTETSKLGTGSDNLLMTIPQILPLRPLLTP